MQKTDGNSKAELDRTNDTVYASTTNVVRAIMALSTGVQSAKVDQYLDLVRTVGLELRGLLCAVDSLVNLFPVIAHRLLKN